MPFARTCLALTTLSLGMGGCNASFLNKVYDPDVPVFQVEIDYVTGAEPYVGPLNLAEDPWSLADVNLSSLLPEGKELVIPHTLDEMYEIPSPGMDFMSRSDILQLASEVRQVDDSPDKTVIQALWLDAQYKDSSGERPGVIGVSLTGTNVIAMFKPTVELLGNVDLTLAFGEQTTFIHEVGHAIGLVNNGVPMTDDHQDEANGAHCVRENCVMYWANEGVVDLLRFIDQYVTTGDAVIFQQDCQSDAHSFQKK